MVSVGKVARRGERQRDAVHHRHLDVGEQQVEAPLSRDEDFERLGAVLRGRGLMTVHGDRPRHQLAHRLLVVGDQDTGHGSHAAGGQIAPVEEANDDRYARRRAARQDAT